MIKKKKTLKKFFLGKYNYIYLFYTDFIFAKFENKNDKNNKKQMRQTNELHRMCNGAVNLVNLNAFQNHSKTNFVYHVYVLLLLLLSKFVAPRRSSNFILRRKIASQLCRSYTDHTINTITR